jgi:Ca2+-binding RTX toxin-like protein
MAWQLPQSLTTPGVNVSLGTTDSAFVATGVTVASTEGNAIRGTGDNHEVLIYGTAVSGTADTVRLGSSTSSGELLTIKPSGHVQHFGDLAAVFFPAFDSQVINQGLIAAPFGSGIEIDSNSTTTQSEVTNSGTIEGLIGILHGGTEKLVTVNSGLISGDDASYSSTGGIDHITNTGRMAGAIELGTGNDRYDGASGRLTGTVFGGDGEDRITGGIDDDRFEGGGSTDTLHGNGGSDELLGNGGGDILRGGAGRDFLTGNGGADIFDFNAISESRPGSANRDQILDFDRGEGDKIDLGGIDANTKKSGDQAFKFIGNDKFSDTPGELRFTSDLLQGDVNGDGKADFEIRVLGDNPVKADFIL